ncbi:MAG TPA: hypothetical protein VKX40_07750 [Aequorivita sp.]|nr:hypothetical protein [Aequorivita sp.]
MNLWIVYTKENSHGYPNAKNPLNQTARRNREYQPDKSPNDSILNYADSDRAGMARIEQYNKELKAANARVESYESLSHEEV